MKRLFIGLELSEVVRDRVVALQDRLKDVATRQGVRFVRPEKIHLTVVFLGHLPEESVEAIDALCVPICAGSEPVRLVVKGLGAFPSLYRPRALWAGVDGDLPALKHLQAALEEALKTLLPLDEKPYVPHLTLARLSPGSKEVGRMATGLSTELGELAIADWDVAQVLLFESTPDGRYEVLKRWNLGNLPVA
ncbi:RNA 2',3'-cyclic phosphodiesterase [Fimbriimonas ginsengisoli]|uniref:RNA 2',3'-cyclic phosphodiesterase n=1 Tax=Fimbriimonas ginsengisoli Gsoil 348 TaxID=661478 RepID=A0A068NWV7_FIMGI|nr:RNA 2',3'-cyclic phosphodiesterase [Fimbriimonas ginsengisoli]AIE87265.1 2'-5' RNA ligase [Fimbriimonas ginsengisoli Gsoil 348]